MRRRHTIPRMSTSLLSFSCWHPILVAIKQPVRPMPALRDRHSSAQCRHYTASTSIWVGHTPALVCCHFFLEGCWSPHPSCQINFLSPAPKVKGWCHSAMARRSCRATLEVQIQTVAPAPGQYRGLCSPFTSPPSCASTPGTQWFTLGQPSLHLPTVSVFLRDDRVLCSAVPKLT